MVLLSSRLRFTTKLTIMWSWVSEGFMGLQSSEESRVGLGWFWHWTIYSNLLISVRFRLTIILKAKKLWTLGWCTVVSWKTVHDIELIVNWEDFLHRSDQIIELTAIFFDFDLRYCWFPHVFFKAWCPSPAQQSVLSQAIHEKSGN